MITINKNYTLINVEEENPECLINPFDLNGNLIPEMIIAIDTTYNRSCVIYIPELISGLPNASVVDFYNTNGQTNFTLKFIKVSSDGNVVTIACSNATTLSGYSLLGAPFPNFELRKLKDTLELTPIGIATDNTYQVLLNAQGSTPA